MKATDLLIEQHDEVKGIFKKLEGHKGEPRALLNELANNLAAHMAIEQDIFYPQALSAQPDLVAESFEEHAVAELALKRLLATDPLDPTFMAKVKTLKELIEHHVQEEEDELFPAMEKAFSSAQLEALGSQMKAAFELDKQRGFDALVPKIFARTTADAANIIASPRHAGSSWSGPMP